MVSRLVLAGSLVLVSTVAHAQPLPRPPSDDGISAENKEQARGLMDLGRERFAAEDYAKALEAYQAADKIMNVPVTGLAVGEALAALGRLIEARDKLLTVSRMPVEDGEPTPYRSARERAKTLAQRLAERIPSVRVNPVGTDGQPIESGVTVLVAGKPLDPSAVRLPKRIDPGEISVEVKADGYHPAQRTVKLRDAEHHVADIVLRPVVAEEEAPTITDISLLVWIGFGVAITGSVVGAATGAAALSKSAVLDDQCPNGVCPPEREGSVDAMTRFAHASTISLAIAGAGAIVGGIGVWLTIDAANGDELALQPLVAPGYLGLRGSF